MQETLGRTMMKKQDNSIERLVLLLSLRKMMKQNILCQMMKHLTL